MKICPHCKSYNSDTAVVCSGCSADLSYVNPTQNQPYQNTAPQYQQQVQQYPQYPYGAGNTFDANASRINNDIQNAKTLGIVSVVFIFIMRLVTFVCALLGMSKAKAALKEAEAIRNEQMIRDAKDAYKTNKIALIITIVLYALAAISSIIILLLNYGVFQQAISEYM